MDLNGDGVISKDELKTNLDKVMPDDTEEEKKNALEKFFKECDANGDGKVSKKEFMDFMTKTFESL